jgi:quercetin dioxygenase-like cupin family protein
MRLHKPLILKLCLVGLGLAMAVALPVRAMDDPHADGNNGVKVTTLVSSDQSWNGAQLPPYPSGQPVVTVLRITIPAGVALPKHHHPMISTGVLLKGRLKVVTESGQTLVMAPGDGLIEVVNRIHYGQSLGPEPAEILVIYAGVQGMPTTVLAAPIKPGPARPGL